MHRKIVRDIEASGGWSFWAVGIALLIVALVLGINGLVA